MSAPALSCFNGFGEAAVPIDRSNSRRELVPDQMPPQAAQLSVGQRQRTTRGRSTAGRASRSLTSRPRRHSGQCARGRAAAGGPRARVRLRPPAGEPRPRAHRSAIRRRYSLFDQQTGKAIALESFSFRLALAAPVELSLEEATRLRGIARERAARRTDQGALRGGHRGAAGRGCASEQRIAEVDPAELARLEAENQEVERALDQMMQSLPG
jgi:hypothetical protein